MRTQIIALIKQYGLPKVATVASGLVLVISSQLFSALPHGGKLYRIGTDITLADEPALRHNPNQS